MHFMILWYISVIPHNKLPGVQKMTEEVSNIIRHGDHDSYIITTDATVQLFFLKLSGAFTSYDFLINIFIDGTWTFQDSLLSAFLE